MSGINRCARCEKSVYPTEELKCLDKVWHKICFKCQECGMTLNMKTYKGFNKLPYCNAHTPVAKHTAVADTPEARRLAENTKIQSQVKYHEEFEKTLKGKVTQVADDPEITRLKQTAKIISNIEYHRDADKKHDLGNRATVRSPSASRSFDSYSDGSSHSQNQGITRNTDSVAGVRNQPRNPSGNPNVGTSGYEDDEHKLAAYRDRNNGMHPVLTKGYDEQFASGSRRQSSPIFPQQYYQSAQPNQMDGRHHITTELRQMQISDGRIYQPAGTQGASQETYLAESKNHKAQGIPPGREYIPATGVLPPQNLPGHLVERAHHPAGDRYLNPDHIANAPRLMAVGVRDHQYGNEHFADQHSKSMAIAHNNSIESTAHHQRNEHFDVQNQSPQAYTGRVRHQTPHQMPQYHQHIAPNQQQQHHQQYQQQQQQQMPMYRQPAMLQGLPEVQGNVIYSQQQMEHHPNKQQQYFAQRPSSEHGAFASSGIVMAAGGRNPNRNGEFRAMFDYTAQDNDEVSFADGDLIAECVRIDEGWMIGRVVRTGMRGMLPANYVEPC